MKRIFSTMILAGFVVLTTASFGFAQYAAAGADNFPYFHLGALVIGGLIIVSMKQKYHQLYMSEAMGSFALYTILIALFTAPVVNLIKDLVG